MMTLKDKNLSDDDTSHAVGAIRNDINKNLLRIFLVKPAH